MPLASIDTAVVAPYEIVGATDAPLIVALGGISAHRHTCASEEDNRPGWWESVAGPGRALDTRAYRLLSFDWPDGGETADGRPERLVTTHDQADALAAVLDDAGVREVHAVIGASYGGMVALAFAERYPDRLRRLVVIGAAHRTHPLATAWRVVQREIVEFGLDAGRGHEGVVLARSLAMTTYRTAAAFGRKFDVAPVSIGQRDATFPVDGYLRHNGERFAERYTPARFLALSLSSDLHRVDPSRVRTPTTIVAETGDMLVPREETEALARELGGPCRLVELRSEDGHDAFLTEPESLGRILTEALTE